MIKKYGDVLNYREFKADNQMEFPFKTKVMGILNITPDSFYDGGVYYSAEKAVKYGKKMIENGADIIDVGGESSRPGSERITAANEMERILPVIRELRAVTEAPISVDTYKSDVAAAALSAGANWINDISAGSLDPEIMDVAAEKNATYVMMHMQGTPETMQNNPYYENVVEEIIQFFEQNINLATKKGIHDIIIDPGIGFGKSVNHNLLILKHIGEFKKLGYPVMVGASRKSFIGQILNLKTEQRLAGSLAVGIWCMLEGVEYLRVHDVEETVQAIKMLEHLRAGELV